MMSSFNFEVAQQRKWNISLETTCSLRNPNVQSILNPSKDVEVTSNPLFEQ